MFEIVTWVTVNNKGFRKYNTMCHIRFKYYIIYLYTYLSNHIHSSASFPRFNVIQQTKDPCIPLITFIISEL